MAQPLYPEESGLSCFRQCLGAVPDMHTKARLHSSRFPQYSSLVCRTGCGSEGPLLLTFRAESDALPVTITVNCWITPSERLHHPACWSWALGRLFCTLDLLGRALQEPLGSSVDHSHLLPVPWLGVEAVLPDLLC